MLKIVALVESLAMHLAYHANRFLPTLRKLFAPGYTTLCPAKTLLHLLKRARIFNCGAVTRHREEMQTHVDAYRLIANR